MKRKEEIGVTLIALVITIIILMILAGVTLNLIIKDNGILAMAKQAKEETKVGEEKEKEVLNQLNHKAEATLDKTPPTINLSGVGTASNATLTAIVTDNESGVSKFAWISEDREPKEEEWQDYTEGNLTKIVTSVGNYYLYVIDQAGNISKKQATVTKHSHTSSCYKVCGNRSWRNGGFLYTNSNGDIYKLFCTACGQEEHWPLGYQDSRTCNNNRLICNLRKQLRLFV